MNLLQVCMIGILGVGTIMIIKTTKPEYGYLLGIAICILLLGMAMKSLNMILDKLEELSNYIGMESGYFKLMMKMLGVAYLCEFSSGICRDAGQAAIAGQIEIWGKLSIMIAGIPVVYSVIMSIYSFS